LGASSLAPREPSADGDDVGAAKPMWREEGDLWIGSNASLEIAVSTRTGTIQRFTDKLSGEDYCHQACVSPQSNLHQGRCESARSTCLNEGWF
jgi:hypothetical protein